MKVSEVITDVRQELLEVLADASFWSDAEIIRLADRAQKDYTRRTKVLEDKAMLTLQLGRGEYPLPANWVRAQAIFHFHTDSSGTKSTRRLAPSNLEKMSQEAPNFLDNDSSRWNRPSRYWIWGRTLNISPSPDTDNIEDTNLWLFYKSKPIKLSVATQDLEIPEELSEAINAYVLWKAWSKEQETDLAETQALIYSGYIGEGLKYEKNKSGDQRWALDIQSPRGFTISSQDPGFNPLNQ